MSLPRSNYDPRRVCLNPFPNLNISFGKHRRTIGVYLAGGLVRLPPNSPMVVEANTVNYALGYDTIFSAI